MAPSVAASPQPSAFAAWGTSPVSSTMRLGSVGSGSLKRLGSIGTSLAVPRPKIGNSATLCPVPDTASSAFEDLLLRTRGIATTARRRSVASSPSGSPPEPLAVVTASRHSSVEAPSSPTGSLIVGFNIGSAESSFRDIPAASVGPKPAPRPAKAKGLLSKALDVPPPVLEAPSPSASFSDSLPSRPGQAEHSDTFAPHSDPFMQFSWFPDVDPRPLKAAAAKHEIFSSELVTTAYMIASRCYRGQFRKNGDALLTHCLETAYMVADLGLDAETVAAALLHEALHGGPDFVSQLEEFMPRSVVERVERVQTITEVSHLYRRHGDKLSDEGMCRMLIAMEDVGAVIVKLACRVHDMRTVSVLPREAQEALARETLDVYSVVANRLGVWYLKAELEDSAFAVLHPAEYATLRAQVRELHDPEGLEETINTIRAELDAQGIKYEDISGRQKNLYGIWTKMQRDGKTLDQVLDVVALRVVVASKHDCYLAMRSTQNVYRTVPHRHKDYIRVQRKANGYQSLHDTVIGARGRPVEVQIRTHKMHYIAEYGFAAHWKYKEKLDSEDEWLDKQVQYKKWLTHYKLGVHDKKVRPVGSPPTDSSLKSLGFQYVDGSHPDQLQKVDEFLKLDRFKLQPPPAQATSVHVQVGDAVEVHNLPADMLASDLSTQMGVGNRELKGHVLLLNGRPPAVGAVLHSGDFVQVVPESAALGRSPPRTTPLNPMVGPLERALRLASHRPVDKRRTHSGGAPARGPVLDSWDEVETFAPAWEAHDASSGGGSSRDLGALDMFTLGSRKPIAVPFGGVVAPPGQGHVTSLMPAAVPVAAVAY